MQLRSNVNGEKAQLIDIIQRLVTGVIDVLEKLMSDYLIGNLYLASTIKSNSNMACSAPVHCVQSKHLGLPFITLSERYILLRLAS